MPLPLHAAAEGDPAAAPSLVLKNCSRNAFPPSAAPHHPAPESRSSGSDGKAIVRSSGGGGKGAAPAPGSALLASMRRTATAPASSDGRSTAGGLPSPSSFSSFSSPFPPPETVARTRRTTTAAAAPPPPPPPLPSSASCSSHHSSAQAAAALRAAESPASAAGAAAGGGYDVFVVSRTFREWGGGLYRRLPPAALATLSDVGVCHFMVVVRDPVSGEAVQFDFGPPEGDVSGAVLSGVISSTGGARRGEIRETRLPRLPPAVLVRPPASSFCPAHQLLEPRCSSPCLLLRSSEHFSSPLAGRLNPRRRRRGGGRRRRAPARADGRLAGGHPRV